MKTAARGSATAALLPSKETLGASYFELTSHIDEIIAQARLEGSLNVALSGPQLDPPHPRQLGAA